MKPLCVIFLGVNRSKDEFNHTYIESYYDSMYVSLLAGDLQTTEKIQQRLKSILTEIQQIGRPQLFLAHSFGCIFAIYSLAEIQNTGIRLICIDPTTKLTRNYAEYVSMSLAKFLDSIPKPILDSVYVITYKSKGAITEKGLNFIQKRHRAILELFSDKTTVIIEYVEKITGKYSAHDIHLNNPNSIIRVIRPTGITNLHFANKN